MLLFTKVWNPAKSI